MGDHLREPCRRPKATNGAAVVSRSTAAYWRCERIGLRLQSVVFQPHCREFATLLRHPTFVISAPSVGSARCLQAVGPNVGSLAANVGLPLSLLARNVSRKRLLFAGSGAAVCRPLHIRSTSLCQSSVDRSSATQETSPGHMASSGTLQIKPGCCALLVIQVS